MQELKNLQDEFEAAANQFPGLTHVVMKWPKDSPKPPLPMGLPKHAELAYDKENLCEIHNTPFGNYRSMIYLPENPTDYIEADVDILHWTIRPPDKSWDKRKAICRLKILSDNAVQIYERLKQPLDPSMPSSFNTLDLAEKWLLKLHELRTPHIFGGEIMKLCYTKATGEQYPEIYPFLPWCSIFRDVFLESALACNVLLDKSAEPEKTKTFKEPKKNGWKPPKGYIGSKEIVNDYEVPRSTLQQWGERDSTKVKQDPQTREVYYKKKWFDKRFKNYQPRRKS